MRIDENLIKKYSKYRNNYIRVIMKSIYSNFNALFLCQWKFYLNPNITEVHDGYNYSNIGLLKHKIVILKNRGVSDALYCFVVYLRRISDFRYE